MSTLKHLLSALLLLTLTACATGTTSGLPSVLASPTTIPPTLTALPPTQTPVPMAIVVNGEGFPQEEFNAELARYKAAQATPAAEEQAIQMVREDLIAELLLAQGAAEAGFGLDEAALQQRIDKLASQIGGAEKLTAWQQAHGYTETSFRVALKRSAAAAWMREKVISSVPSTNEQVHVRQILLYNETVAQNYYNQLQAGADFDELAAQVDPVTRGDIGWFPRGYLTEKSVEEAAFSLEIGQTSQIITSEVGFHLIKVLEREPNRPLSPDALTTLQHRALLDWLDQRRQQSSITQAP